MKSETLEEMLGKIPLNSDLRYDSHKGDVFIADTDCARIVNAIMAWIRYHKDWGESQ